MLQVEQVVGGAEGKYNRPPFEKSPRRLVRVGGVQFQVETQESLIDASNLHWFFECCTNLSLIETAVCDLRVEILLN